MSDIVLDSNALSAWAEGSRQVASLLEAAQRHGGIALVPTVCLVESLSGHARDATLNQRLKGTRTVPLDAALARKAAVLRGKVDGDDAADPVVVATAAVSAAPVVSTDPDIERLGQHAGVRVVMI